MLFLDDEILRKGCNQLGVLVAATGIGTIVLKPEATVPGIILVGIGAFFIFLGALRSFPITDSEK